MSLLALPSAHQHPQQHKHSSCLLREWGVGMAASTLLLGGLGLALFVSLPGSLAAADP